jgi:anti-anti-sigma factor
VPPRQRQDPGSARGWSLDASRTSAGHAEVRASGEFDLAAIADVHRVVSRVAAGLEPPAIVVVDLSQVTFLDAAMLGALVTERQAILAGGGDLVLSGVTPWAMRIIEICGLRETLGV